jgi:hypothetical protein
MTQMYLGLAAVLAMTSSLSQAQETQRSMPLPLAAHPMSSSPLEPALRQIMANGKSKRALMAAVTSRNSDAATQLLAKNGYRMPSGAKVRIVGSRPGPVTAGGRDDLLLTVVQLGTHTGTVEPVGMVKIGGLWVDWNTFNPIGSWN